MEERCGPAAAKRAVMKFPCSGVVSPIFRLKVGRGCSLRINAKRFQHLVRCERTSGLRRRLCVLRMLEIDGLIGCIIALICMQAGGLI